MSIEAALKTNEDRYARTIGFRPNEMLDKVRRDAVISYTLAFRDVIEPNKNTSGSLADENSRTLLRMSYENALRVGLSESQLKEAEALAIRSVFEQIQGRT